MCHGDECMALVTMCLADRREPFHGGFGQNILVLHAPRDTLRPTPGADWGAPTATQPRLLIHHLFIRAAILGAHSNAHADHLGDCGRRAASRRLPNLFLAAKVCR